LEIRKTKRMKLTGKILRNLYDKIYLRDGGRCVNCGAEIEYGLKFHHEPCGSYKSDEPEKLVMLCPECHYERHNTWRSEKIREKCVAYLQDLYGEKGAKRE
jgi:5-methylcytosine-specific restriction endonuclease McrA